ACRVFDAWRVDDPGTLRAIAELHRDSGLLVDPHTAVGVAAARARGRDREGPIVALATAHPAKFPDAVERATGVRPALPDRLAGLFDRPERVEVLPNDLAAVQGFIRDAVALRGAA
ncbi:MAG: threonine synthase, partial [Dongiaceae bacterium]